MELKNCWMKPAVVVDDYDPLHIGRIKAVAAEVFDNSTMDIKAMYWAYPLTMSGSQSYSRMMNGQKVWLIHDETNYYEYWYIPYHEQFAVTDGEMADDPGGWSDVLHARPLGGHNASISYNDVAGYNEILRTANIQIGHDGKITLNSGGAKHCTAPIHLSAKQIILSDPYTDSRYLSKMKGYHDVYDGADKNGDGSNDIEPVVKAEKLIAVFNGLKQAIDFTKDIAMSRAYTIDLQKGFEKMSEALSNLDLIKSKVVFVN